MQHSISSEASQEIPCFMECQISKKPACLSLDQITPHHTPIQDPVQYFTAINA
jgi:hypothetical protein